MASWRKWTRIVAIVELVHHCLSYIAVLLCIIFASQIANWAIQMIEEKYPDAVIESTRESFPVVIRIVMIVVAVFKIPFLVLSIYLFKASKKGADTLFALKVAKIWRVVNIIAAVFSALGTIPMILHGNLAWLAYWFEIILISVFIYVVNKFIKELKTWGSSTNKLNL